MEKITTKIKMSFDPNIAKHLGVEEAIMYSNLDFWVEYNKANNKNFHDGHYWTYNSQRAFAELFNFWTEKQILRILKNLGKNGYIKVGNYNNNKYDRTSWYTTLIPLDFNSEKSNIPNRKNHLTKRSNDFNQTVPPIPNNKTTDNKTTDNLIDISDPIGSHTNTDTSNNPHTIKKDGERDKQGISKASGTSFVKGREEEEENGERDEQGITTEVIIPTPQFREFPPSPNSGKLVNQVNLLMYEFQKFNPCINYGNITQRKALDELVKKFGEEKTLSIIKYAVSVQGEKYAPLITNPLQLKNKLGELIVFYKRNQKGNGKFVVGTDFTK